MTAHSHAKAYRLEPGQLHLACDPESLGFRTTADLEPLRELLGQDDAVAAVQFGMESTSPGYNVFVLGATGSGRATFVRQTLASRATSEPAPSDWCYVSNFADERKPKALSVPAGKATAFRDEIDSLIKDLREALPRSLSADDVAGRRAALADELAGQAAEAQRTLEAELAEDPYVALVKADDTISLVPARGNEPLRRDALEQLPPNVREVIDQHLRAAQLKLFGLRRRVQELHQVAHERIAELNREVVRGEIEHRLAALGKRWADSEAIAEYLDAMGRDILEHGDPFAVPPGDGDGITPFVLAAREDFFRRYAVNPIIARDAGAGTPVIEEPNPTLTNLLGTIERRMQFGVMVTDFTRITAGALHRANGGYLILDAAELLSRPLVWPALKRVLRTHEIKPTEAAQEIGLFATESLEPDPIPLNVKVVLIGEPYLYYLLQGVDSDFRELFKVKSDFRPYVERNEEAERRCGAFVATRCAQDSLPAFEAGAVARIIEEASRLVGHQRRLTTRLGKIADLVREAALWASNSGNGDVRAADVERALAERDRRNNRPHREMLELIREGVLAFEPRGDAIGQLYGIGLTSIGDTPFGRPIRVIASAFLGTGGLIDIEREAELSGPIHNKGFLVLSGYLGRRFAREHPLIVSASLSFDQLYEEVEGDSASAAELFALMSAIGGIPLRQGIAVTGAVNQDGLVLPVGGVTEKVEGFFAACERTGLSGEQGVILPHRNADNLVLRANVRDAVANGQFHVHAVDHVEDAWPILCGIEAGQRQADGTFPGGTVHHAVARQLDEWSDTWSTLGKGPGADVRPA